MKKKKNAPQQYLRKHALRDTFLSLALATIRNETVL
jgi:hypothetical protein